MELKTVHIHCASLRSMYHFYRNNMGFPCGLTKDRLEVQVGVGRLIFTSKKNFKGGYHYAFAIRIRDISEAFAYLRTRTSLFYSFEDDSYIADFRSWKARSLFFSDADGNVVELIARAEPEPEEPGEFGPSQVLRMAEIGLGTPDVNSLTMQIRRESGVDPMLKGEADFRPLGSREGLFIVSSDRRNWYPSRVPVRPLPVEAVFENHGILYRLTHDSDGTTIDRIG